MLTLALHLYKANLYKANLHKANLSDANLTGANLIGVNLSDANLSAVKALGTNFHTATLTGICTENWNINSQTNLQEVTCKYVFTKHDDEQFQFTDRRPHASTKYLLQANSPNAIKSFWSQ